MNSSSGKPRTNIVDRLARLQPWYLLTRSKGSHGRAAFAFFGGAIAIGILGVAASLAKWPLLLPSLGPTSFLIFWKPSIPESSPRNIIAAHAFGVISGGLALYVTGLEGEGSAALVGYSAARVIATSLALAVVSALMILTRSVHAPGASTALIVALGLMTDAVQLLTLFLAAAALCATAWLMNRAAGIYYPLWFCRCAPSPDGVVARALMVKERVGPQKDADDRYADLARDLVNRRR